MSSVPSATWSEQLRDVISSPLGILAMTGLVACMAYMHVRKEYPTYDDEDYEKEGHVKIPTPLKDLRLTKHELEHYDAENPDGRYLVALMGNIYDVSSAPQDFGPKGSFKTLSGHDIFWYVMKTARFESRDFDSYLVEWVNMLEDHFYVAGVLVDDQQELEVDQGPQEQDPAKCIRSDYPEFISDLQEDDETVVEEFDDTLVLEPNSYDFELADITLTQSEVED